MVSKGTIEGLLWHAGLADDPSDAASVCGSTSGGVGVGDAARQFRVVLDGLNREMNGPQPSGSVIEKDTMVPRSVAYAVAEVSRMLTDAGYVDEAWRVDYAWTAVLAGDVDDLERHIEDEVRARALDPPERGPLA